MAPCTDLVSISPRLALGCAGTGCHYRTRFGDAASGCVALSGGGGVMRNRLLWAANETRELIAEAGGVRLVVSYSDASCRVPGPRVPLFARSRQKAILAQGEPGVTWWATFETACAWTHPGALCCRHAVAASHHLRSH